MPRTAIAFPFPALLTSRATPPMIPSAIIADLAPNGRIRAGTRVVVGAQSAYDLFLSRELKHATIVRAPSSPAVTDFFIAQRLDVAAGVKQQLEADAKRLPGLRLLDGRFMVINQAMGTPRGRDAGAKYLADFVVTMKTSGFVAQALQRHGIEGAAVAQ